MKSNFNKLKQRPHCATYKHTHIYRDTTATVSTTPATIPRTHGKLALIIGEQLLALTVGAETNTGLGDTNRWEDRRQIISTDKAQGAAYTEEGNYSESSVFCPLTHLPSSVTPSPLYSERTPAEQTATDKHRVRIIKHIYDILDIDNLIRVFRCLIFETGQSGGRRRGDVCGCCALYCNLPVVRTV